MAHAWRRTIARRVSQMLVTTAQRALSVCTPRWMVVVLAGRDILTFYIIHTHTQIWPMGNNKPLDDAHFRVWGPMTVGWEWCGEGRCGWVFASWIAIAPSILIKSFLGPVARPLLWRAISIKIRARTRAL